MLATLVESAALYTYVSVAHGVQALISFVQILDHLPLRLVSSPQ